MFVRRQIKSGRIYIVGFMGAGKSTLGKKLANKSGFQFQDIDTLIEEREQKSINELFNLKGADYFRKTEREVLHSTNQSINSVFATGGGTPFFFDNMDWMNKNGTTIYIRHDEGMLFSRLRESKSNRPLIGSLSGEDLKKFIFDHLVQREVFYKKAKLTVEGKDLNVDDVLKRLIFSKKFYVNNHDNATDLPAGKQVHRLIY